MNSLLFAAMLFIMLALWTGQVNCQPRQVECNLEPIENGEPKDPNKTTYYPGEETSISCYYAHKIYGPSTVRCLENGTMTARPTCVPMINCSRIPKILNGQVNQLNRTGPYKHASFSCDEDYELLGDPTTKCTPDGDWDIGTFPVCVHKRKVGIPPVLTHILNGYWKVTPGSNTAEYLCYPGYHLTGNGTVWWADDGKVVIDGFFPVCMKDYPMCPKEEENNNVLIMVCIGLGIGLVITCLLFVKSKQVKRKSKLSQEETDEHDRNETAIVDMGVVVRVPDNIPEGTYPPNDNHERAENDPLVPQHTQEEDVEGGDFQSVRQKPSLNLGNDQ